MVSILADLFNNVNTECGDKEKALEAVRKSAPRVAAESLPGKKIVRGTKGDQATITRSVHLTPAEAEALDLGSIDGVTLETVAGVTDNDEVKISLKSTVSIDDCITPIAQKQDFISVHSLINALG